MSADVVTAWGVVLELNGIDDDRPWTAADVFARGRDAYLERCPRLTAFLTAEGADPRVTAEDVGPIAAASREGGGSIRVSVGVSVVEVRRSSFDMAVRIRPAGGDASEPVNGRCTVVLEKSATGDRIPIPRDVRDEFISIQLAARELC